MYEPIRAKSVHTMAEPQFPHRSREEELDIQLAGHLAALLAVTDELRNLSSGGSHGGARPAQDLDSAASRIADEVARLRREPRPRRPGAPSATPPHDGARVIDLHRQAHTLAGRALVVAASRADTTAAILAAERMDAHAAALAEPAGATGSP